MTTTLYCKSTSRAKYLFIVDIRDALLISWHKAHKWLLTKKTWEKTSFALRLLIWADLQNHSEWKEGRGDCEAIHIFGVKYPGCQIIWQVTRASVFTARPSADSKPLRAFGPPAPPPFANCGIQQPSTCRGKKMLRHSKKLLYCSQVVIHPSMSVCGPILVDTMFRN